MAKKVYFAFDYEDVADFRANVVRNHKFAEGVQKAGYFDASIWEEAKKKDPAALKKLIDGALENTTVTAVLIGTNTYSRRWVRYELMRSIQRGNRVLGIHINSIAGKDIETKALGPNPLEYLGVQVTADGKNGSPVVWNGQQWAYLTDVDPYEFKTAQTSSQGNIVQLTQWSRTYDWVAHDGYNNFKTWIA
jgi:Thoeris protein ThsB, TIR-like domain